MLPSSTLGKATPRQNVRHLQRRPASISPPASFGDQGSPESFGDRGSLEEGVMLRQHDFKEAEATRSFWQVKFSQDVRQILEMSAETVRNLTSVQLQVQQLQEVLEERVTSCEEGLPQAPETPDLPPKPTPRAEYCVDSERQKLVMHEMLHDAMHRFECSIAKRLEELHERLDEFHEVHLSNIHRFEEVMQHTATSSEQQDRLEALLSNHQEEAMSMHQHKPHEQLSRVKFATQSTVEHIPSSDPLVEFGKVSSKSCLQQRETENGNVDSKRRVSKSVEALHAITNLQLASELSAGGESAQESDIFDALDVQESPVDQLLRYINRVSLVVVLANTIFMGVTLDIAIDHWHRHESPPQWIQDIEITFTVAYCIEMLLRVALEKKQFCMGPNAGWNMFDLIIILFAVFDFLHNFGNFRMLRIFRILRIAKTARALRSMKLLRVWRVVISQDVLCPMIWSSAMLIGFLFVCALVFTTFAGDFTSTATADQEAEKTQLLELYGSVPATMKTIFAAVTGGESWRELSRPLSVISDLVLALYWVVIFIVIFGLMNTVTAVYCDAIIFNSNTDRLSFDDRRKFQLKQLRSLMQEGTSEPSGRIKKHELMKLLQGDAAPVLKQLGLELWVAQSLFSLLDAEKEGAIDIDEFIYLVLHLKGNPQNIHIASLEHQSKKIIVTVQSVVTLLEQTVAPQLANLLAQNALDRPSTRKSFDGRDGSHYEEPQRLVTTTF
mmetsp:Transcript_101677/g.201924  ORF Transcript_101677/g.201924 Transcript_101677/m.201924 type:complete len:725 (+) Transcript_101677:60-2234(+)